MVHGSTVKDWDGYGLPRKFFPICIKLKKISGYTWTPFYPFPVLFDYERMEWFLLDRDFYITGSSNPGKGGYITGLGNYQRGEEVIINAVPASGYLFVEWKGGLSGADPTQKI